MTPVAPAFWFAPAAQVGEIVLLPFTSDYDSGGDGYWTDDSRGYPWQLWGSPRVDTAKTLFGNAMLNLSGGSYWCDNFVDPENPNYDDEFFVFGSGDWTIEFFYIPSSVTSFRFIAAYGNNTNNDESRPWLWSTDGTTMRFRWVDSTDTGQFTTVGTVAVDGVYHLAASRVGDTIYCANNGTIEGTIDVTGLTQKDVTGARLVMFGQNSGLFHSGGYFGQVRFWKGYGAYTTDFTPPSAPF